MVSLDDRARLAAVERTRLHDSEPEAQFDRLTRLAARLVGADLVMLSLVDADRQYVVSQVGLPEPWASRRELPLSRSFCRRTVEDGRPFVVDDARERPELAGEPAVEDLGLVGYAGFPLFSGDGHPIGALCAATHEPRAWRADELAALEDVAVTAASLLRLRKTAESSVQLASQYAVVAHAARAIGEVHGDDAVFERIADLAVLDVADLCMVDLLQDGRLEQVAFAPRDERRRRLHAERAELLADAGPDHPAIVALRTAATARITRPPDGDMGLDPRELDLYRRLDIGPALLVPLIFHGAPLGVVSLARRRGAPAFSDEEIAVVEAVAHHISAAVSAERLIEEHRNVTGLLQRTLLPRELPTVPGLQLATWYEAGEGEMEVGGDFYDVIERPDGSWMLVIGDVCGRGPGAAAMTGVVRHTLRGLASNEGDLGETVAELNRRIYRETESGEFVTLAVVGVEIKNGDPPVVHATLAGHPPPMVIAKDGAVTSVGRPGLALGLEADTTYTMMDRDLAAGDALVLYTDGLTEAHGGETRFDRHALAALLAQCAGLPADAIVRRVQRELFAVEGDSVSDDVAVMAAQVGVQ